MCRLSETLIESRQFIGWWDGCRPRRSYVAILILANAPSAPQISLLKRPLVGSVRSLGYVTWDVLFHRFTRRCVAITHWERYTKHAKLSADISGPMKNQIASMAVSNQWWSVTKYNYFVTVLKYIFQVSVLYWSSFILSNFYFYFTTFQSIRSYFLLHYIS